MTDRRAALPLSGGASRSSTSTRIFITRAPAASDWADVNAARFRAGERIGITYHVASILGTLGLLVADLFSVAARRDARQRRDARAVRARAGSRSDVHDGEPELHRRTRARRSSGARRAARSASSCWRAAAPTIRCSTRSPRSRRSVGCRCCTTSGSTARANGRRKRSLMAPISRGSPRGIRRRVSSLRTSAAAATTCTPSPPCATCRTSIPDLSGSGVDRGMLDAAVDALGAERLLWGSRPDDVHRTRQAARARRDRVSSATTSSASAGRTRRAFFAREVFRGARVHRTPKAIPWSPERARDRRQHAHRRRIRSATCRIPIRTRSCACSTARASTARGSDICRRRSIAIRRQGTRRCTRRCDRSTIVCGRCRRFDLTGRTGTTRWPRRATPERRRCARIRRSGGWLPAAARRRACVSSPSRRATLDSPLLLTVRFEDLRQRHPMDSAGDLTAATVRALARAGEVRCDSS